MAVSTQGTTLSHGNDLVGEVTSIKGPEGAAKQVDVTPLEATSRQFIAGIKDGGEVTIEYNFVPGNVGQAAIEADYNGALTGSYTITVPTVARWTFNAIVTKMGPSFKVDDALTVAVTLKTSGDVVRVDL